MYANATLKVMYNEIAYGKESQEKRSRCGGGWGAESHRVVQGRAREKVKQADMLRQGRLADKPTDRPVERKTPCSKRWIGS